MCKLRTRADQEDWRGWIMRIIGGDRGGQISHNYYHKGYFSKQAADSVHRIGLYWNKFVRKDFPVDEFLSVL